jgi:hypothetical protein
VGLIVLLFLIASSAPVKGQTNGPSSIVNGGFDTGNFNNWTLGGAASITNGRGHITYATIVDNGSYWYGVILPHSPPDAAYLATFGAPGYLSQTLSTAPGMVYTLTISFWVNNSFGDQNVFVASFNGTTLFGATNLVANSWINIQTNITIIGPPNGSSVLQFTFEDDDGDALGLDDVSVSVVMSPPPAPTNLVAVAGYEQVALSWAPSAGATLYFVKRSTTSGAETNICILYATNYTDTGLADGTKYYYEVTAANLYVGGTSSEVSATTAPPRTGGVAFADSSDFTLNTGGTLAGLAGVAFADSSDFTLNTGGTLAGLAGVAFADSTDFTLNTGGTLAGLAGVAFADSSDFTLNTGGVLAGLAGVAFADSTDFTLNTGGTLAGLAGVAYADSTDFTLNTLNNVVSGLPHFTGISVSGRTLTLNAANGTPGGQYALLGSTNLALNLWTTILTGTFDSSGSLNLIATNLINPAVQQEFYMLKQ